MVLVLLFLTGLFAGTVDAIAGGGGLISLPILLSLGIPPHLAVGTNKIQGTIGTLAATHRYYRHGLISLTKVYKGILFGLIGSILGAVTGQVLSADVLHHIIPILLLFVLIYTLVSPRVEPLVEKSRMNESWFYVLFGFALGFYDGFFGPGTGSLWVFAITYFLGYNLIKATAYTKVFNLNSSLIATICFAVGGNIDYRIGLCMAAGQLLGGRLGAYLAIKNGARLIRPMFLAVVATTIGSLVYKRYIASDLFTRLTEHYGLAPQIIFASLILTSGIFVYMKRARV